MKREKNQNYVLIVLPLSVFLIGLGLHDVHGILRLAGLVLGTYILFLSSTKDILPINVLQALPWLLVLGYIVTQLIVKNDLQQFALGNYGRNGGIITLICFALIFNSVANYRNSLNLIFLKMIIFTFYGLIVFGILEKFKLLPFEIKSKYEGAISLTLVNPNFASSYLAIALSVFILYNMIYKNPTKKINFLILALGFFIFIQTKSIQGWLLILINLILFIFYNREKLFEKIHNSKKILGISFIVFSSFVIINYSQILSWVRDNGSVTQRLNYWKLTVDIWKDHFFVGIGLESLRDYAPKYRGETLARQEGTFTNPDRAHNVFLDHFVQGGVLIGLIWLLFVLIISAYAIKNLSQRANDLSLIDFIIILIWFGYVVQSAISVDHIALTLLGTISGALISRNHTKSLAGHTHSTVSKSAKVLRVSIISTLFFGVSIFLGQIIRYEYWAYGVIDNKNPSNLQKMYDSRFVVSQTLEDLSVELSKSKNFETGFIFANKLLIHRPSSHQAYYIRSTYYESKSDLKLAKQNMLKALELDPFNSVYLLSLAIYEYGLGDFDKAKDFFIRAREINPNQEGLEIVSQYITY